MTARGNPVTKHWIATYWANATVCGIRMGTVESAYPTTGEKQNKAQERSVTCKRCRTWLRKRR